MQECQNVSWIADMGHGVASFQGITSITTTRLIYTETAPGLIAWLMLYAHCQTGLHQRVAPH